MISSKFYECARNFQWEYFIWPGLDPGEALFHRATRLWHLIQLASSQVQLTAETTIRDLHRRGTQGDRRTVDQGDRDYRVRSCRKGRPDLLRRLLLPGPGEGRGEGVPTAGRSDAPGRTGRGRPVFGPRPSIARDGSANGKWPGDGAASLRGRSASPVRSADPGG